MNKSEYKQMYDVEKCHWWFQGKITILRDLIHAHTKKVGKALDFGCGTGALMESLQDIIDIHGVDISPEAIYFCQKRGIENVKLIDNDWAPDSEYSLIIATDVVEHIQGDVEILNKLWKALKPNGVIIITVPAFKFLWSEYDVALHHKRRYTYRQLVNCAEEAGFRWSYISYYNTLLFPVAVIIRLGGKFLNNFNRPRINVIPSCPFWLVNNLLYLVFQSEKYLLRLTSLPFGLSLVAIAKKYES